MTWKNNVVTRFFEPFYSLILLLGMLVGSGIGVISSRRFRRFVKGQNRQPSWSLPLDKLWHFVVGVVVVAVTFWLVGAWSFLLAVGAGIGKEVLDYFDDATKKDVECMDALATALGGLLATLLLTVLFWG